MFNKTNIFIFAIWVNYERFLCFNKNNGKGNFTMCKYSYSDNTRITIFIP